MAALPARITMGTFGATNSQFMSYTDSAGITRDYNTMIGTTQFHFSG